MRWMMLSGRMFFSSFMLSCAGGRGGCRVNAGGTFQQLHESMREEQGAREGEVQAIDNTAMPRA